MAVSATTGSPSSSSGFEEPRFSDFLEAAKTGKLIDLDYLLSTGRIKVDDKDPDGYAAIHWAVLGDHRAIVERLVDAHADIDIKDRIGQTSLHLAIDRGFEAIVERLVAARADLEAKDKYGKAPLHLAAWHGHTAIVEWLVAAGANVDVTDSDDRIPLHNAVVNGHANIVEKLINAGANIYVKDAYGETPLDIAVRCPMDNIDGVLKVIPLLMREGADVDDGVLLKSPPRVAEALKKGRQAYKAARLNIFEAAETGNLERLNDLLRTGRINVDDKDSGGNAAIHWAVIGGHREIVERLVAARADIDIKDKRGEAPLHLAIVLDSKALVEIFIEAGANVDVTDSDGRRPLHLAATNGHANIVGKLINAGANIYVKDAYGETALDSAVRCSMDNIDGVLKVIPLLMREGADVDDGVLPKSPPRVAVALKKGRQAYKAALLNIFFEAEKSGNFERLNDLLRTGRINVDDKDPGGKAAIHWAVENGHLRVLEWLVAAGADIDIKDKHGATALHYAAWEGNAEVMKYLIDVGADPNAKDKCGRTPLHEIPRWADPALARFLVERGGNPHAPNARGYTPLHTAAANGKGPGGAELVRALGYVSNPHAQNGEGKTPLHTAAKYGRTEVMPKLIARGSDIEAKDMYGQTPLHTAAGYGNVAAVEWLVAARADLEAKDKYGRTPLHVAAQNCHLKVVESLVAARADLEAKDLKGRTALDLASLAVTLSKNSAVEIIDFLMRRFAKLNPELLKYLEKQPPYVMKGEVIEALKRGAVEQEEHLKRRFKLINWRKAAEAHWWGFNAREDSPRRASEEGGSAADASARGSVGGSSDVPERPPPLCRTSYLRGLPPGEEEGSAGGSGFVPPAPRSWKA